MPLSCSCDWGDWEPEPGDWQIDWHESPDDFEPLKSKKRQRCKSCNTLIDVGSMSIRFERARYPYSEVEARIIGFYWDNWEEPTIKIAPVYICEKCGEIYLNLSSLGYCVSIGHNIKDDLKEYWELTGFQPIGQQ